MNRTAGTLELLSAAVYLLLASSALIESLGPPQRATSRQFGLAFAVLALTGGARGVLCGVELARGSSEASLPLIGAVLLGLLPATVFCGLRYEAYVGGAGDRIVHGNPNWVPLLPAAFAFAAGAILVLSWTHRHRLFPGELPGAVVAVVLVAVGWNLLRAQQTRHNMAGGWSVSGLAIAMVFPSWAVIDAGQVLAGQLAGAALVVDWLAVPAAMWFLVECRRLVSRARRSGPRATLAVSPQRARGPAPWARTG